MSFLHKLLLIAPAACLLAQTPPATAPAPAAPPATAPAAPAPRPATPIPPGLLTPPAAQAKPVEVPPDKVVFKAGSVTLTRKQFDELVDGLQDSEKAQIRGPMRTRFADFLVQVFILSEEAKRRKLEETHAYQVQSMLSDDRVLAGLVMEQIRTATKVDEADARNFYEQHIADRYEVVTARHILIRVKGSQVPVKAGAKDLTDEEALAKANDLRKRIAAGEDIATLAKTESDDAGSAANGGMVGPFARGAMKPSFEQAAFSLKPGELSEPVKTDYGYHIIKVETHRTKPFEEVRAEIERQLAPQAVQKALDNLTKDKFLDPDYFPPAPPPPARPPMIPRPVPQQAPAPAKPQPPPATAPQPTPAPAPQTPPANPPQN
jgi:peptidyl-prolyl cis-trans isomerase C